ncbi:transcriptional regulator [Pseudofrankia sp. EUN1h]|nr:transcriptional regulator [Pseudofrankia sp. EUN1h]
MLAEVALDLFRRDGFDNVTINDIAAAAGVSRSTVLRHFGTKEDAVLGALDAHGAQVADALRARPPAESDWVALRRALDIIVEIYRQDPAAALATTHLVLATPALHTRQWEKQHSWRPALTRALAERGASPLAGVVTHSVRAAAALDCLNIAIAHWARSGNTLDLAALLDEAFAALGP